MSFFNEVDPSSGTYSETVEPVAGQPALDAPVFDVAYQPRANHSEGITSTEKLTFAQLSEKLADVKKGRKAGECWLPVTIPIGKREKERVQSVNVLVLDVEADTEAVLNEEGKKKKDEFGDEVKKVIGVDPPVFDSMADALAFLHEWHAIIHTSYSHSTEHPRYRIVVELSRPLLPNELKPLGEWAASKLGISDCYDHGALEPARLFYLPRCPSPERLALFKHKLIKGDPLDVDAILAEVKPPAPKAAPQIVPQVNGKPQQTQGSGKATSPESVAFKVLAALVRALPNDSTCDYAKWFDIGCIIHHETNGSQQGYELWHEWSAKNSTAHDPEEMPKKYASGRNDKGELKKLGSLIHYLKEAGIDWRHIKDSVEAIAAFTGVSEIKPSDDAQRISRQFLDTVREVLGLEQTDEELAELLAVNPLIVDRFLNETIRNGANKSEVLVLNKSEYLNNHAVTSAWSHLAHTYGNPFDRKKLSALVDEFIQENEIPKTEQKAIRKALANPMNRPVMWHIEYHNQRAALAFKVDMFAKARHVELQDRCAAFTLTPKPYIAAIELCETNYRQDIIDDYKEHFPEFDEVLKFIVAARFAPDRKKAYLWIHAPSDWGKGFFKSVLNNLKLTAELSVKEVEAFFEGKPVGRDPDEFIRSLCLVFDEFKSIKSELKQLENTITLTPKFRMASQVEVFAKLFLSAENVASLVGESGIEDQLANRYSCILGQGIIENRPLFLDVGKGEYIRHITGYAQKQINGLIDYMIKKGRSAAQREAELAINAFHTKYGIDKLAPRLSEAVTELSDTFLAHLHQEFNTHQFGELSNRYGAQARDHLFTNARGEMCLSNPSNVLREWLKENTGASEYKTLVYKSSIILANISKDGEGKTTTVRDTEQRVKKALILKWRPSE